MAVAAIDALKDMGVRAVDDFARFPLQVTTADLAEADFIVALKQTEHLPLLQERFLAWIEKVEFWQVDDAPEVLALIEREVMGLITRLIGSGKPQG
jgi:protein-tyrosine phosphatase